MNFSQLNKKMCNQDEGLSSDQLYAMGAIYKDLGDGVWGWLFPDGSKGTYSITRGVSGDWRVIE